MIDKKVLFILEGDNDEPSFVRRLMEKCYSRINYKTYTYRTSLHILSQELYEYFEEIEEDNIDNLIDIRMILRSTEPDEKKKKLLTEEFNEIYLIFDMDPQCELPHFDTIYKMIKYFNDSTQNGKLYINYPMMQSYKHFNVLPDNSFINKKVNLESIRNYKQLVHEESNFKDLNSYTHNTFFSLGVHHLKKANYILNNKFELFTTDEFLDIDESLIYRNQLDMFNNTKEVYVLNTSIFILFNFNPKNSFNYINNHKHELLI